MATWGATTVNILREKYWPPTAEIRLNEIAILPDPASLSTAASILQQGGTKRKRVSWEGYVTALADYNTLEADKVSGESRLFTGPSGETLTGVIEHLEVVGYPQDNNLRYYIVIVES